MVTDADVATIWHGKPNLTKWRLILTSRDSTRLVDLFFFPDLMFFKNEREISARSWINLINGKHFIFRDAMAMSKIRYGVWGLRGNYHRLPDGPDGAYGQAWRCLKIEGPRPLYHFWAFYNLWGKPATLDPDIIVQHKALHTPPYRKTTNQHKHKCS